MSQKPRLRTKGDTVINFTNRVDIKPTQVLFEISPQERTFRYRITLRTWAALVSKISSRHNLTLQFERGGEPAQRVNLGNAEPIIRGGGVISGEIDGGFDPASLGLKIVISDPSRSHMIVAAGTKGKPDIENADIGEDSARSDGKIVPIRPAAGREDGLIDIYESAEVAGGWNLKMRNVECPHLVVSPLIGKQAMSTDPRTQMLVFPEVFRRIVKELAVHPEQYVSEPWAKHWKKFAAELSGIGEWSYFTGEDDELDHSVIERRIEEAVQRYQNKHLDGIDGPQVLSDVNCEE